MPTGAEISNRKFAKQSKSQTLSGSNTTVVTALFRVTGSVLVTQLYSVVTTVLGTNVTATHYRLNDQTAQVVITSAAGTTVSAAPVGSLLLADVLAATALTLKSSAAGAVRQPAAANHQLFSPSLFTQKTGGVNTDIEFVYSTTNTPTSGVLTHFIEYETLSNDGAITVL